MRPLSALSCLALLTVSASAQNTVVSTRTFVNEAFDLANWQGIFDGNILLYDLGLDGHSITHGTPTLIEIQLSVRWDVDIDITSQLSFTDTFCFGSSMYLSPVIGDCQGYSQVYISESTGPVMPGSTTSIRVDETTSFNWTGSTFSTACPATWTWNRLNLWSDPSYPPLAIGGCGSPVRIPTDWIHANRAQVIINGEVKVTWAPNLLPSQTACPGTESPTVHLRTYGGVDATPNVYLIQEGAPMSTNILIESDQAAPTIQASGLCVAGTIHRLPGGLSQGGSAYRLPNASALIGATTYFQSWFRTGTGTSGTSECIQVTFP